MRRQITLWALIATTLAGVLLATSSTAAAVEEASDASRARLADPTAGIIVVAHRGCHNPSPRHGLASAPENSIAALDHCVAMGVDVMEVDVQRTADGHLVMIHDDTVDRTMTGVGRVGDLTLEQLRSMRLLENLGGPGAVATEQRVSTLEEMLAHARGRILLNLDVKAPVYAETIEAVVRAGAERDVIVKTFVGVSSPALAAVVPFDRTPFMPILTNPGGDADLAAIALNQVRGASPVAIELPRMTGDQLAPVVSVARVHGLRLMINTIGDGFVANHGDIDALRHPDGVWGALARAGVTIFQTDEPEALVLYRSALSGPPSPEP